MASLTAPHTQPPGTQRRIPTTLLNLDCSADLTSYSRSLGPAAQTRPLPLSSDALRAQFERHREHVLRHRQVQSHVGASPAQTPQSSNALAPARTFIPPVYQQHIAHAPPLHSQVPPAPPLRSQSPVPGDMSMYPTALRQALERSAHVNNVPSDRNIIYNLVVRIDSHHSGDSSEVVRTYKNVHLANLAAAQYIFEEDFYASRIGAGYELKVELKENGTLFLETKTDGSMGGRTCVYIRPERLGD